jgi:hypothetical protein
VEGEHCGCILVICEPSSSRLGEWLGNYLYDTAQYSAMQCSEVPLNKFEDEFEVKVKSAVDS